MEPSAPIRLAETFGVVGVSVGRVAGEGRVHDCPVCGGYLATDEWHLRVQVRDTGRDGGRSTYLVCDDDCLDGWVGLYE